MDTVVFIAKERGEKVVELKVENDGSLLYSALVKFFPDVRGLFYFSKKGAVCGVQFANGKFYPPQTKWGKTMFYCTFLEVTENDAVLYATEKEGSPIVELPLEKDGSLLYTTLVKFFPKARGLMYYSTAGTINGVRLTSGRFFPKSEVCGSRTVFYCVFFEESIDEPINLDEGRSCTISHYIESADTKPVASDDLKNGVLFENYSLPNFQTSPKKEIRDESLKMNTLMNKKRKRYVTPVIKMKGRPFKCNECSARFLRAEYLRRHERLHTGEKPFSCLTCDKRFPRSDYLKNHIRSCHVNAKLVHENLGSSIVVNCSTVS